MRLILTRPQDDLDALIVKLRGRGHECVESPLLTIAMRENVVIPVRAYQAIALSSANAMNHPVLKPASDALAAVKVFAVGAHSAHAARKAGYRDVRAEGGNVEGLAQAISRDCKPSGDAILYPSGAETAGDLKGTLEQQGFTVDRIVLYDAVAATTLTPQAVAALASGTAAGVLLYSPRSAKIWSRLVAESGLDEAARHIRHFCLSPNVAAALGSGIKAEIAARPDEPSLLALLDRSP